MLLVHGTELHDRKVFHNFSLQPKKNIPEGSHQHELMKHAAATLGSGNTIGPVSARSTNDKKNLLKIHFVLHLYRTACLIVPLFK
jgi:hypothetical protein